MPVGLDVNPKIPVSGFGQSGNAGTIANQIQDNEQEAVASNGGNVNQSNTQSQSFSREPESPPSSSSTKSAPAPECVDFVDEPNRLKRCVRKRVKEEERNITHNRWPVDLQLDWPADLQGLVRYDQVSLPPEPLTMRLTLPVQ